MKLNQFAVYRVDQQTAGKALWHLPYQCARCIDTNESGQILWIVLIYIVAVDKVYRLKRESALLGLSLYQLTYFTFIFPHGHEAFFS